MGAGKKGGRLTMENKQTGAEKEIEKLNLLARICDRAERLGIRKGSRLTATMDVNLAADHFNMKLNEWAEADDFNFAHDFVGIQNHIDRITKTFDNRFLPRFATNKD